MLSLLQSSSHFSLFLSLYLTQTHTDTLRHTQTDTDTHRHTQTHTDTHQTLTNTHIEREREFSADFMKIFT